MFSLHEKDNGKDVAITFWKIQPSVGLSEKSSLNIVSV